MPFLSVVIPTHDTRDLTLRCLASVMRAAPEAEVVVVDDAGGDGTAEAVAAAYPAVRVLRLAEPAGFTRAANLGLAAVGGELLLLLNSDTELDAAGIAALRDEFASDPRLGVAGAALHYPDGTPQWSGGWEPSLLWLFGLASGAPRLLGRLPLYRRLKPPGAAASGPVEWVTGAALALRRAAWEEAGPFDESFDFYGQDLDLCAALRARGWGVALLGSFRVLHHHGATIGRDAGAAGRQHPELLWRDLLRWARKRRGEAWARRAARALAAGARARLLARAVAVPFLPPSRRPAWREGSRALRQALGAVRHRTAQK
jgi:hypothetical protein